MTAGEIERSEERLEFWDARTETAWKVRDVSIQHEQPTHRLTWLAGRLSSVRGLPIECFGSVSLVRREATGRRRWVMQADQIVYLHARRSRPSGPVVHVGEDELPDVVLEVDHTTDVRRWKLKVYQECGFPEIWVSVPWERSLRSPGLTIHVRDGARYRESPESVAFPGWRSEEIHRALTEEPISGAAWRTLERVGRAMGARDGTSPADDPLTRSLNAKARAAERAEAVRAVLRARGIPVSVDFAGDRERFAGLGLGVLMAAAQACTDEADFRRRIGRGARMIPSPAGIAPSGLRRRPRSPMGRPS